MSLRKFLTLAAVNRGQVITGNRRPLGYQALTVGSSTAVGFSFTAPQLVAVAIADNCNYAIIQNPHASITALWRDDGTDPTTTVGMQLRAGQELQYAGDLRAIKFIAASSEISLNISIYA
jgi:hypothetical protein